LPRIRISISDARWYIFKPKIPFWVNFGRSCNGRCWYFLRPLCLFYGQIVYFMAIWYIMWSFGIFFPVWVYCTEKNLATLISMSTCLYQKLRGTVSLISIKNIDLVGPMLDFDSWLLLFVTKIGEKICTLLLQGSMLWLDSKMPLLWQQEQALALPLSQACKIFFFFSIGCCLNCALTHKDVFGCVSDCF
jgi:hypothetical protein